MIAPGPGRCYMISDQPAFHDLVKTFVTQSELTDTLLPTMEKAVLRSPYLSHPSKIPFPLYSSSHSIATIIFNAYSRFRRVLSSIHSDRQQRKINQRPRPKQLNSVVPDHNNVCQN